MNRRKAWLPGLLILIPLACLPAPRFYPDDPLQVEPDTEDASGAEEWEIGLFYDLAENLFAEPGDKAENVRAQNLNTIDEVPDSSWYTNRIGLTASDIARGPDVTNGPAAGPWLITAAKNDGITPGFTIKDSKGNVWFIKPDPPGYPAMATGTEVAVTKLFWALGYNVPENHLARMKLEDLVIDKGTRIKATSDKRRLMKVSDIKTMMRRAHRDQDGTYRVHASLKLEGKPLGGIRFFGTRPDDPNDVIAHEHRRELRGYGVFSAWLNHVDSKAINALDTLVRGADGKAVVRHYLLDFGSTLGSGAIHPHEYWEGYEHIYEGHNAIKKDLISFGFRVEPWRTQPYYESKSIGRMPMDNDSWDPESWRARVPNQAFLRARADDKFWAARKVVGFTDEMIRAAVSAGQFNDPQSEDFLVTALLQRRDAIAQRYLPAINPITDPAIDLSGTLTFSNAAVNAGVSKEPAGYEATWHTFDNESGNTHRIGTSASKDTRISPPSELPEQIGSNIMVEIRCTGTENESWLTPVRAYFHRIENGWKWVGFERMP